MQRLPKRQREVFYFEFCDKTRYGSYSILGMKQGVALQFIQCKPYEAGICFIVDCRNSTGGTRQ